MWEHGQGLGNVGENLAQPGSAAVEALSGSPSSAGSLYRIKCACDDQQLPCTVAHLAGGGQARAGSSLGDARDRGLNSDHASPRPAVVALLPATARYKC